MADGVRGATALLTPSRPLQRVSATPAVMSPPLRIKRTGALKIMSVMAPPKPQRLASAATGTVKNAVTTASSQSRRGGEDCHLCVQVLCQRLVTSFGPQFEAMFIVRAKRCRSFELEAAAAATSLSHVSEQEERQNGRRQALAEMLLLCSVPIVLTQMPGRLLAEEAEKDAVKDDQSIVGGLLSLFDPNETTKQGKRLPKAYLKSARDVVKTLRDSFSEDPQNDAKFRRNADSAKGAIREYISNWRGTALVNAEESYQALERALRVLSEFYSKKGPRAPLPEDVRVLILEDLQKADDAL